MGEQKITINTLRGMKQRGEKITALTAYDALMAGIFDGAVEMILVGDSLNMSFNGQSDTLSVGMEAMLYHTRAVRSAVRRAFLLADMPFGSYADTKSALKNATRFYKEAGADAVKLEVGASKVDTIKALADEGILAVAHIGLMPQFVRSEGGYKVKGGAELVDLACAMENAGACAILLEGTKASIAREVTKSVRVPVIGIGSGADCDGQILVWSDAFGFFTEFKPKFVRRYMDGAELLKTAVSAYVSDVKARKFPNDSESY